MITYASQIKPTFHHSVTDIFWACAFGGHLTELEPDFKRPNKKIDSAYKGEYDLYLDWSDQKGRQHYIKIEVKASRANDREKK